MWSTVNAQSGFCLALLAEKASQPTEFACFIAHSVAGWITSFASPSLFALEPSCTTPETHLIWKWSIFMAYFSTFPVDLVTCWPPPISQEMFFSAATKTNFRPLSFFCVRSVPHTTHVPRATQAPHLSFSRQQRLRDPDLNFVPFLLTNGIRRLSLWSLRDNEGLQNLPTPTTCNVNDLSNT